MKKILTIEAKESYLNAAILILRLSIAVLMLTHGFPKLEKLLEGGEIKFADPIGLGPAFSLILVVFAEFFCSILIGIGLFTRLATIPLIINMSVAAFIVHEADPIGRKELALLYLLIYLTLTVIGGRKYSVDSLLTRNNNIKGTGYLNLLL